MGGVVHVEPDVRMLLPWRDQPAHAIREDLRATARKRAEPRVLELAENLLVREPGQRRHVVDLRGRVALEMHIGERLVERCDRPAIEVEVDVRVLAVDHVDLGEARDLALAQDVLDELVSCDRVGLRLLARRREGAELAFHAADVGLVHVQVLDEIHLVRPAPQAPGEVGELAEREQVVRLEERDTVLETEPLARLDLLADRLQCGQFDDGHAVLTVPGR
jgi:hypothetical protein